MSLEMAILRLIRIITLLGNLDQTSPQRFRRLRWRKAHASELASRAISDAFSIINSQLLEYLRLFQVSITHRYPPIVLCSSSLKLHCGRQTWEPFSIGSLGGGKGEIERAILVHLIGFEHPKKIGSCTGNSLTQTVTSSSFRFFGSRFWAQ